MSTLSRDLTLVNRARLAGFMYLLVVALYMAGQLMSQELQSGSFSQRVESVADSEMLLRTAMTLMFLGSVFTIFLTGSLYLFLRRVDPDLALFALLSRTCEAALGAVAKTASFTRFGVYTGDAEAFGISEQVALTNLSNTAYSAGFNFSVVFFCIGSILFFYLLLKSRFIPRVLAILGLAASAWTLLVAFASLIGSAPLTGVGWWIPMLIAELVAGIWLLSKGINVEHWQRLRALSQPGDQGK